MEIKEPKFREGQKVRYVEDRNIYTIECVNSYSFKKDEYSYNLLERICTLQESNLELYIEKPNSVWELQKDDKCFFINSIGSMIPVKWDGTYCAIRNLEIGNVFLTKEEAEYELERRKIETEMISLGGRRKFQFDGDNYGICYCDGISVEFCCCTMYQGLIYFDTRKEAEEAIKEIGKNRIKKYIFGVNKWFSINVKIANTIDRTKWRKNRFSQAKWKQRIVVKEIAL